MKNIINKFKGKLFISTFIFIIGNIILNYLLYIFNLRFRLWFILLIIIISIIGFTIGMYEQFTKIIDNKLKALGVFLLGLIPIIILIIIFLPFILVTAAFTYKPEHTVTLHGKKYVAVVRSFLHVDVDYYNYYGPLLMGTKVKVHGYFGEGGYDPYVDKNISTEVEYIYYDDKGKEKKKIKEIYLKDKNGNITDIKSYEDDYKETIVNENDNYLLPEDMDVLFEKKIDENIIKFVKLDDSLGNKNIVQVIKSTNNGKTYEVISDNPLNITKQAKYQIINENILFASNEDIIKLNNNANLYISTDGGKTFVDSNINYQNENVEFITIEKMPYQENNKLKFICSIYQLNSNKDNYETKELIFISNDNGLNWYIKN